MTPFPVPRALAVAGLALLVSACAAPAPATPAATAPPPTPVAGEPTAMPPDGDDPTPIDAVPPGAPPRELVTRFEDVELSPDGLELTLRFTGGRVYRPDDPCSVLYQGWASAAGDTLWAAVVDVTPPFPQVPGGIACDAMGHARQVTVAVHEPFRGIRVRDLAGDVHFVRPPEGLAVMPALPGGWELRHEADLEDSPTGRWVRTWSPHEVLPLGTSVGRLDLYQAFGGPVNVTGGDGVGAQVAVNGTPATLYRTVGTGEIVLTWSIGDTSLAIVADDADFPVEDVIRLAEGVTLP